MEKVIETASLSKRYDKLLAVDELNLEVKRNEIYGFVGPNGAGKTTTIKMLLGLLTPTSGSVNVLGYNPTERRVEMQEKIGYTPEIPNFPGYLSAWEMMEFYGGLYTETEIEGKRIEDLLKMVDLWNRKDQELKKFSKGMIQRLAFAQALIHEPELIILDEPISGLDPGGVKKVRDYIKKLPEQDVTVFFSSHILSEVEKVCDRMGVIKNGQIVREGMKKDLVDDSTSLEDLYMEATGGGEVG